MITLIKEGSNIPFDSKRNEKKPYLYLTKHGIGPGTLPKDVKLCKVKDLPNYYTAIWLDRPLSTDELKYYDIYPETKNNELLDRLGISIEELEECNTVEEAKTPKTKSVKVLQGNYGYGWDDLCEYPDDVSSAKERKDDLKSYKENEPGVSFRIITRRVNNPDYVPECNKGLKEKKFTEDFDDYDDYDDIDPGDIVYEGKAYYNKRYSGLAHSEQFSNASDMYDWVWSMCQDGYYVTVYDYEDSSYSYYKWPDNAEYMDLSSAEELETDERGNFLYIDDIGPK